MQKYKLTGHTDTDTFEKSDMNMTHIEYHL